MTLLKLTHFVVLSSLMSRPFALCWQIRVTLNRPLLTSEQEEALCPATLTVHEVEENFRKHELPFLR